MDQAFIARVFCDKSGRNGNPVGIIDDSPGCLDNTLRKRIAIHLGYSETVFINSIDSRSISIYTISGDEIPFAGHAAVGAAAYLSNSATTPVDSLLCQKGQVEVIVRDNCIWVVSPLIDTPPWKIEFINDLKLLESLTGPLDPKQGHSVLWSWVDEEKGVVRARTFASLWNIPEDEANGSGCMQLAAALGRQLVVIHGVGSVVHASPARPGWASVGGEVAWDDPIPLNKEQV